MDTHDIIVKIVLALVLFLSMILIFTDIAGGKGTDLVKDIISNDKKSSMFGQCIELEDGDGDFSTGSENLYTVTTKNMPVRDIQYLWLKFDLEGVRDAVKLESWTAYCHENNVELFDAPVVFEKDEGTMYYADNTYTGYVESNGYNTEISCDKKIDVYVKISDDSFSGTGADVYLCYYPPTQPDSE